MTDLAAFPPPTTEPVHQPPPFDYYTPKKGDIFVCSWGYDQTNVNAYIVVKVTPSGKSVYTKPVALTCTQDDGPYTRVRPTYRVSTQGWDLDYDYDDGWKRGQLCPVAKIHRIQRGYQNHVYIKIGRDYSASLWDGHSTFYETGYGFGH